MRRSSGTHDRGEGGAQSRACDGRGLAISVSPDLIRGPAALGSVGRKSGVPGQAREGECHRSRMGLRRGSRNGPLCRKPCAGPPSVPIPAPDVIRGQAGGEYQRNQSPSRLREGLGVEKGLTEAARPSLLIDDRDQSRFSIQGFKSTAAPVSADIFNAPMANTDICTNSHHIAFSLRLAQGRAIL